MISPVVMLRGGIIAAGLERSALAMEQPVASRMTEVDPPLIWEFAAMIPAPACPRFAFHGQPSPRWEMTYEPDQNGAFYRPVPVGDICACYGANVLRREQQEFKL
jgi:hypothetical protein